MSPVAAGGSGSSLVAWEDTRASDYDIYAARVRADGTVPDTAGIIVAGTSSFDWMPRVVADGEGFRVVWFRSSLLAAARVDTSGNVVRTGDWFAVSDPDQGYDVVQGSGPDLLALFCNYTDLWGGRRYGVIRVWAKFDDVPGIEGREDRPVVVGTGGASVVRSVLFLGAVCRKAALLDATGRRAMELEPGPNDVSQLAPGVYFVRERAGGSGIRVVQKLVLTR
jgi:hypothetical protein